MSVRRIRSFVLASLWISGVLTAQATNGPLLSLEQCLDLARTNNPRLLASLQKYKASRARINQALEFPQPSVRFDSDLQPGLLDFRGSRESYLGIEQTLEFPGKRSLRGKIASLESEESLSEVALQRFDLAFQVKQAFYGLLLAQETTRYAQQDLDISSEFLGKAEAKLASGDIAEVEVLRARVETSRTANALKVAANEASLAASRLQYLIAWEGPDPIAIRGELKRPFTPLDLEDLKRRAYQSRPEVRGNQAALTKEGLKKTQAVLSWLPDVDLGIARHRIAGEPTTWDVSVSVPVPLFFWQPKKGAIAEAEANRESLKREGEHLRDTIGLEVEEACLNALSASEQIRLYEAQILAQAEEVYRIFLFRFEQGEVGGIELVEARRSLNEVKRTYADALFNYRVTIAALERAIGQSIDGDSHE